MVVKGNKNGVKLKLPQIRQEAYRQYCNWIANGKPKKAWSFEHPKHTCCWRTMEKYIVENPLEFQPLHKEIAHCKGYCRWFELGIKMVEGKIEKCQPAVYQMIMRNMFGWDRENSTNKETTEPLIKKMSKLWRGK